MVQSRNWAPIERLPEQPGVAVMTSTGYWLNGEFHSTKDRSRNGQDPQGLGSRGPVPEGACQNGIMARISARWRAKRDKERWGK